MKIGFVILCYGQYELVIQCVNLLFQLNSEKKIEIILVDNCSPDDTGKLIYKKYLNSKNVHVILNKSNIGFAKGNNIGYQYARNILHCECIVVMNSDVFIYDKNFINKILVNLTNEPNIAIIAPDILRKNYSHSNPLAVNKLSKYQIIKGILLHSLSNILLKMNFKYYKIKKRKLEDFSIPYKQYGIVPLGACIIYCKPWLLFEDKAFYSKTFLFCEEFFLHSYAKEKNYIIAYLPDLVVMHCVDASINISNENEKRIFINNNQIKSLKLLLEFEKDIVKHWHMSDY